MNDFEGSELSMKEGVFFGLRFLFELGFGACDYDWETHWDTLSFLARELTVDSSFARNTVGADLTQRKYRNIPEVSQY